MIAAAMRLKNRLSEVLAAAFPRTTAYLRETGDAGIPTPRPASKNVERPRKPAPTPTASSKPRAAPGKRKSAPKAGIYGPGPLPMSEPMEQAMRERVAVAVAAGVVGEPSDEQWAMILARAPATRIFAGAGSGKSTTLVLRVAFMLGCMGIRPDQLTIISFTNETCVGLRAQLIRVLAFWGLPFGESEARRCVRTFHSAMGVLARDLLGSPAWFEQMDDRRASVADPDNPLAGGSLRPAQRKLLNEAYERCYAEQPAFRERVHALLGLSVPEAERDARAPLNAFRLAGELRAVPLPEAFYSQAGFIESVGIPNERIAPGERDCPAQERDFLAALTLFRETFERCLAEQGLMTFNGAFQRLTALLADEQKAVSAAQLEPFRHLLIDEFQDISPIIVRWLQALHRRLAQLGSLPSIMAIGDDWQSIYGWRGSSPELFMDFDRHFPGRGRASRSQVLMLRNNYRSIEPIVRDAERTLADVTLKQDKTCRATRPAGQGSHGLRVLTGFDVKAQLPELLKLVEEQCRYAGKQQPGERTGVLLLSRRNEPLKAIAAQLDRRLPVKTSTIHRAKGLQAEVAIILDEDMPPAPHPLRSRLYACSGLFRNSYDQAMQDEARRLAYVAVTRGVSRVIWIIRRPDKPEWMK